MKETDDFDVYCSFNLSDEEGEFTQEACIGSVELELGPEPIMPNTIEINGITYVAQF